MLFFLRPLTAAPPTVVTSSGPMGPAFPPVPVTAGNAFPYFYPGAFSMWGLGVAASIGADTTWRMAFLTPTGGVPSGQLPYLQLWYASPATSGSAFVSPRWAMAQSGQIPSSIALISEGSIQLTWGSTDANKLRVISIPLDATTITDGWLMMDLVFVAANWTVAQPTMWLPFVEYLS